MQVVCRISLLGNTGIGVPPLGPVCGRPACENVCGQWEVPEWMQSTTDRLSQLKLTRKVAQR